MSSAGPGKPESSVAASRREESRCAGSLSLNAGWVEEIQYYANDAVSHGDTKGKHCDDRSQHRKREQERGHEYFFRCALVESRLVSLVFLAFSIGSYKLGLNPGWRGPIYSTVTLTRVDGYGCWQLRYVSRVVLPLSRSVQNSRPCQTCNFGSELREFLQPQESPRLRRGHAPGLVSPRRRSAGQHRMAD